MAEIEKKESKPTAIVRSLHEVLAAVDMLHELECEIGGLPVEAKEEAKPEGESLTLILDILPSALIKIAENIHNIRNNIRDMLY